MSGRGRWLVTAQQKLDNGDLAAPVYAYEVEVPYPVDKPVQALWEAAAQASKQDLKDNPIEPTKERWLR